MMHEQVVFLVITANGQFLDMTGTVLPWGVVHLVHVSDANHFSNSMLSFMDLWLTKRWVHAC